MMQIRNSKGTRSWVLWASIAALFLMTASCAKPPQNELESARAAIETARDMGAAEYAPADLRAATDALAEAEAEVNSQNSKLAPFRNYNRAGELAENARQAAEQAQANVEVGKARIRGEAEAALAAAHDTIDRGRALIAGPEGAALRRAKETREVLDQISADLDATDASLAHVSDALAEGRYTEALSLARQGNQEAMRLVAEVENAVEKRQAIRGVGK